MKLSWDMPIFSFDFETTGIDKHRCGVVQYGMTAQVHPDAPIKRTGGIVNPPEKISEDATRIHGITERMKQDGIPVEKMLELVSKSISWAYGKDALVVAFNMQFDWTVFTMSSLRHGHRPHPEALRSRVALYDPLVVDRALERYRKGKKNLDTLMDLYDLKGDMPEGAAHNATWDAEAALRITREQLGAYEQLTSLDLDDVTKQMAAWHVEWADNYEPYVQAHRDPNVRIPREWPFIPYTPDYEPEPGPNDLPPFEPNPRRR